MKNYIFLTLAISIIFYSCSGLKEKEIKPSNTEISGELGKYFQIVDGSYKIEYTKSMSANWSISVKFKRTDKELEFDPENARYYNETYIALTCLDEQGRPVNEFDNMYSQDLKEALLQNSDEVWIKFTKDNFPIKELSNEIMSFSATSNLVVNEPVVKADAKTISHDKFTISSNAKNYFKVAEGDYKPYIKDGFVYIKVTFELLKTYDKNVQHEQAFVELVAQNGDGGSVIHQSNINFRASGNSDGSLFYEFLKADTGKKQSFEFSIGFDGGLKGDAGKAAAFIQDLEAFLVKLELN